MPKDKEDTPFDKGTAYEKILKVPADRVKERIRKTDQAADDSLLTSKDLFGEIIEPLGGTPATQDSATDESDADKNDAPSTDANAITKETSTKAMDAPPAPPGAQVEGAPPKKKIRSDTVPVKSVDRGSDEYSLIDLAYSTLLRDDQIDETVGDLGDEDKPGTAGEPEGAADYGQYLLLDRIAVGGMAEVFRAKRKGVEGFEKVVAVKRILPHLSDNKGFVEMFIDEAKVVAGLSHPNIVQIFELGKIDDTYFIAMEYVDGMDLRTILHRARAKGESPNIDQAALIVSKMASALEYAHRYRDAEGRELRIVHRDVSPQNILISREGEIKLVDFGIAKAATKASHTDSGSLRGKLLYMSPEQAWGRSIDNRSDIFSLGVVFFELLTGRNLFSGDSEMSILERVRNARVVPPSSVNRSVPIELDGVVTRMLRKEPEKRYQDASEMLIHIDSYLRRRPAVGSADLARFLAEHIDK
jgi:tRNA A-37 threonylcarbamoyl transferase component Bud32